MARPGLSMNECLVRWRAAHGKEMETIFSSEFHVLMNGEQVLPSKLQLTSTLQNSSYHATPSDNKVPLEFHYPTSTASEEDIQSEFDTKLQAWFVKNRITNFKDELAKKQERELRRRAVSTTEEGGDVVEESWRNYLHTPHTDTKGLVTSVKEARGPPRCIVVQVCLSPLDAEILGRSAFPLIFEAHETWNERTLYMAYAAISCFIAVLVILWVSLLFHGFSKRSGRIHTEL